MGIDYTFRLVYGFELEERAVHKHFERSTVEKVEGIFHMEDRFDPKTGQKVEPEKIWDRKPKTKTTKWYEIGTEKYNDLDSEEWENILESYLGCHVETFGSFPSGDLTYVFYVNQPIRWQDGTDYGKVTIYNDTLTQDEIKELSPKAEALKEKLLSLGFSVESPRIFIAQRVS